MPSIWFISDTHFHHANIIKYCNRPFKDPEEMNEALIENWNAVVRPNDHVWHLGDVGLGFGGDASVLSAVLRRLAGKKRLVIGNHDSIKSPVLHQSFEKIELWRGFKEHGFTCVHIPLAIGHLRDGNVCVHGHIHNNVLEDQHYINVCVEQTGYKPVHLDEIRKTIADRNLR